MRTIRIILDYTTELYRYPKLNILKIVQLRRYRYISNHFSFDYDKNYMSELSQVTLLHLELLLSHVSLYSIYYLLSFQIPHPFVLSSHYLMPLKCHCFSNPIDSFLMYEKVLPLDTILMADDITPSPPLKRSRFYSRIFNLSQPSLRSDNKNQPLETWLAGNLYLYYILLSRKKKKKKKERDIGLRPACENGTIRFCSGDQAATRGFNTSTDKISQALIQFSAALVKIAIGRRGRRRKGE